MAQTALEQAIYERQFTAEDIATFIALQWVLDRAQIKVVDLDPAMDDVELAVQHPDWRGWYSFEEACAYIAREITERRDVS